VNIGISQTSLTELSPSRNPKYIQSPRRVGSMGSKHALKNQRYRSGTTNSYRSVSVDKPT
jgi:hypothetical protein